MEQQEDEADGGQKRQVGGVADQHRTGRVGAGEDAGGHEQRDGGQADATSGPGQGGRHQQGAAEGDELAPDLRRGAEDDRETQAGSAIRRFGGKMLFKHPRKHGLWNSRAGIAHRDRDQRRPVVESIAVDEALCRAVRHRSEVEGIVDDLRPYFHAVRLFRGLEGIDGEVQQDLEKIRAVDFDGHVRFHVVDDELMALGAGMAGEQIAEIRQGLAHTGMVGIGRVAALQKRQVAAGDLETAIDLPGEVAKIAFEAFELLAFDARGTVHRAIDELDEAGNNRQRAIQIVEDTGINLALGPRQFFFQALIVNLALEGPQFLVAPLDDGRGLILFRGPRHRGAHGGNIEGLVQVVACAVAQRLARGLERFVGGEHHHLDRGFNLLQGLE